MRATVNYIHRTDSSLSIVQEFSLSDTEVTTSFSPTGKLFPGIYDISLTSHVNDEDFVEVDPDKIGPNKTKYGFKLIVGNDICSTTTDPNNEISSSPLIQDHDQCLTSAPKAHCTLLGCNCPPPFGGDDCTLPYAFGDVSYQYDNNGIGTDLKSMDEMASDATIIVMIKNKAETPAGIATFYLLAGEDGVLDEDNLPTPTPITTIGRIDLNTALVMSFIEGKRDYRISINLRTTGTWTLKTVLFSQDWSPDSTDDSNINSPPFIVKAACLVYDVDSDEWVSSCRSNAFCNEVSQACGICTGNFAGEVCTECKPGWAGNGRGVCATNFDSATQWSTCTKGWDLSTDCTQCLSNFTTPASDAESNGSQCSICANGWTGLGCDVCPSNYAGDKCDQCFENFEGELCDKCAAGWGGDACADELKENGTNSIGLSGALCMIILTIATMISF